MLLTAFLSGLALYSIYRVVIRAFYTVKPNERAVLTSFGRAQRFGDQRVEDPRMTEEERARYRSFVFGVADPLQHVMGYFISVLRERIANFSDPKGQGLLTLAPADAQTAAAPVSEALGDGAGPDLSQGVSINDLRKNLPLLNAFMEQQCVTTGSRYGIE